jgi:predicted DNA-binding protein with PD1-like motif
MGHMLAPLSRVAEPIEVAGIGFTDATFEAMPDRETNFTLFEPVHLAGKVSTKTGRQVLLAKVRPNQDVSLAIEEICIRQGIARANVYGIGSLNGVRFVDGTRVDSHATEVQIRDGHFKSEDGRGQTRLNLDVVDIDGVITSGEIVPSDNPVCITFELVIEEIGR